MFQPGKPWDGIGKGLTELAVLGFSDFPLYWFGPSISGYNLQSIDLTKGGSPPGSPYPEMNRITFAYGACTPALEHHNCAIPAYIHVQSVCFVRPEQVEDAVKDGGLERLPGGALLQRFKDGHVVIWSGSVMLDIG